MEWEGDKPEGDFKDFKCSSVTGFAVWCDSMSTDPNGEEQVGFFGNGDTGEYDWSERGRFCA